MGLGSPIHWIILAIVAVLVLGGGRFSTMMTDVAKGVKNFKKGMSEDDEASRPVAPRLQQQAPLDTPAERELKPMRDDRPSA